MRYALIFTIAIGLWGCDQSGDHAPGNNGSSIPGKALKTYEDSVSYAIGVNFGMGIKQQKMEDLDMEIVAKAMQDCMDDKDLKIGEEQSTNVLNEYFAALQTKRRDQNLVKAKDFLENNKSEEGVQVTESGLQYIVLKEGTGEKPTDASVVKTHYHGTLLDGTVFDSSVDRGEPVEFAVGRVIPGWTEALKLMSEGAKYKLFIPPFLAYGERGSPPNIGPQELLIFEVELLEVVNK